MAKVTAQMIRDLRTATGAGILDAKTALVAADGDYDAAVKAMREKGLAKVAKKASRAANEGLIQMYAHPGNRVGVMLEINCETDFVARNENFQRLASDIALQVAAMTPLYLDEASVPKDDLDKEVEVLRTQALNEGKPEAIVEKIVTGRVKKYYEENCLMNQRFVKDEDKTIRDLVTDAITTLGENIVVRRFARFELGGEL